MFKRKNNEEKLNNYKEFIKKLIVDELIQKEILDKINLFVNDGTYTIEDNNLYAKLGIKEPDYLEIKFINNNFICNYSEWNLKRQVTITQKELKHSNIKINKREKNEVKCDGFQNETSTIELEKIYNEERKLAYTSKQSSEYDYNTYSNYMEYNDRSCFSNYFDTEKTWYLSNGTIIKYNLRKNLIHENADLEEYYSICKGPTEGEFSTTYYYIELDKELFKSFMTGEISINELLEKAYKNKPQKKILSPNTEWI